jgi:hypothetical protein
MAWMSAWMTSTASLRSVIGMSRLLADEIDVARYARLVAGSQLHSHASSGDEHDGSVIVYGASQSAGKHHRGDPEVQAPHRLSRLALPLGDQLL